MSLYYFLLIIFSLSCGSLPPADVPLLNASLATVGIVAAWIILSHVAARVCALQVTREQIDPMVGAELLEKQMAIFRWLAIGVVGLCLVGFGLGRTLGSIPIVGDWIFLQSIVLLLPGTLMAIGTWSAEHHYGVLLGFAKSGVRSYLDSVWQGFRGGLGWLILPVMMLLGISDLIGLLPISADLKPIVSAGAILAFAAFGLPVLIRRIFRTSSLGANNEAWIRELMDAARLKRTRAVRWETGGKTFNAMVAGFVPPLRSLLISDRLIDELPPQQVAMVVLHEAAHLRRRHVPIRMLSVLPAWGFGVLATQIAGDHPWALVIGSLVGILMTVVLLRLVAYRTEHDADVVACRMAESMDGTVANVPVTYDEAADSLSAALLRVTMDQPSIRKPTWLHPGVIQRIDWMRAQNGIEDAGSESPATGAEPSMATTARSMSI